MAQLDRAPVAQFKIPRLRIVWKSSVVPEARWFLGLVGFYHKETPRRWWIVFSTRGTLAWSGGTLVAGYFIGASALYYLWGRSAYSQLTYADLVLPTRWSEARHKRGDALIADGIQELRDGRGASGIMLLSHGIVLAPQNTSGRVTLASIYVRIGLIHRAHQLLVEGLEFGRPSKGYRDMLFRVANYLEDYEEVAQLTERLSKNAPPDEVRWLNAQKAVALEKLKRYDELDALHQSTIAAPLFAVESAWARSQIERGNATVALDQLKKDPTRFGLPADRYAMQVNLQEAAGDYAAVAASITEWEKSDPTNASPKLEKILMHARRAQTKAFANSVDSYLLFFNADPGLLVQLFKKLSDLNDPQWLRIAWNEAQNAGIKRIDLRILYVQGLITTGQTADAEVEFEKTKVALAAAKLPMADWINGTHFVLQVVKGDSPSSRAQLIGFANQPRLSPDAYRFMLRSLKRAGLNDLNNEIATLATNRFPAFRNAYAPEKSIVREGDEFRIATTSASEIKTEFAAQLELRALKDELKAKRWEDARSRIRKLERAKIDKITTDLRLARIELHGELREQAELVAAAKHYLANTRTPAPDISRLALAWAATPELQESALTLSRATAEAFPKANWAVQLRKKLEGDLTVAPVENEN
ncbi:hypothetical protein [Oleiharenicola lentus]|uniref:hypothetical protein n=1 Tax=Oleiharenicola lentus TaxID=2508720 RepID=UPI003F6800E3